MAHKFHCRSLGSASHEGAPALPGVHGGAYGEAGRRYRTYPLPVGERQAPVGMRGMFRSPNQAAGQCRIRNISAC
ncbi:hypothetical protein GCM10009525_17460 [Streptosporangium amethystogenes subsp. fukuiense]